MIILSVKKSGESFSLALSGTEIYRNRGSAWPRGGSMRLRRDNQFRRTPNVRHRSLRADQPRKDGLITVAAAPQNKRMKLTLAGASAAYARRLGSM